MIKALFTALTRIDESIDSPEAQEAWERRRHADENDLDDDDGFDCDTDDSDRTVENSTGWFGLW